MDALPINEPTGLPFRVEDPGQDARLRARSPTAIVLGVAAMLSGMRDDIAGRVMFVFQPAEETLTGAAAMLAAGAFAEARARRHRRLSQLAAASHRHGGLASRRGDGVVRRLRS
jgi:metal-dependent amidase/aminoacylase/carboxypeptidase family protein